MTADLVPATVQKQMEERGSPLLRLAEAFEVDSNDALEDASAISLRCDDAIKFIHGAVDPVVTRAWETHKAATGLRTDMLRLPVAAKATIDGKIKNYLAAQEEARKQAIAEAARLEQEKADRQRAETAAAAEKLGDEQTAERILEQIGAPPSTPSAMPMPAAPQLSGQTVRKNWKAREKPNGTDALIEAAAKDRRLRIFLLPDVVQLNKRAKADEAAFDIPGFEAWNDVTLARSKS